MAANLPSLLAAAAAGAGIYRICSTPASSATPAESRPERPARPARPAEPAAPAAVGGPEAESPEPGPEPEPEPEPAPTARNAYRPQPRRLDADQRGQLIAALRLGGSGGADESLVDSLPFSAEALVELSLAECIGAPGALARLAADSRFLGSLSCLTALDLSASMRGELSRAEGYQQALFTILEAMPATLATLTLPAAFGDFAYDDLGDELGAAFGRMKGKITSLTIPSAIQGSSDCTPSFVQALNHQWLPKLPHLTSLSLPDCALHSAETLYHCRNGPQRMRGGSFGPQESCQFADLAAAAPNLTSLDLSGNLLTRVPDAGFGDENDDDFAGWDAPAGMEYLAAMLKAMPKLRFVRLGIYDEETRYSRTYY